MNYKTTVQHLVDLENEVLINTDDSIIKACEEHAEFIEALQTGDVEKTIDEAADALTNTLCATLRTCDEIPNEFSFFGELDIVKNTINQGKWLGSLQTLRKRYTRQEKTTSKEVVLKNTKILVEGILAQAKNHDQKTTIESLLAHSLGKIEGRMAQYLPTINPNEFIRDFKDFPKPGILFKDIAPLLASPEARAYITKVLAHKARNADIIVGLDARGFIFGSLVAHVLDKPFVMARKPGKMPGELYEIDYGLEYGTNRLTIQKDAIEPGQTVAIIDDLLATGGSAEAGAKLVSKAGGIVDNHLFVIELDALNGRDKLNAPTESILHF